MRLNSKNAAVMYVPAVQGELSVLSVKPELTADFCHYVTARMDVHEVQ